MARSLVTPQKTTAGSTATVLMKTTANGVKVTTNGAYLKTGGASRIDPTRLVFWIVKNSSVKTSGYITVVSGSTDGNSDYFPGAYSTANNLNMQLQLLGTGDGGVSGMNRVQFFYIQDIAKYADTDDYIKFNFSSKISSGTTANKTTQGARFGALYLKHGAH